MFFHVDNQDELNKVRQVHTSDYVFLYYIYAENRRSKLCKKK